MTHTFQKKILEEIIARYPSKKEAVSAISTMLGVGPDAVYRRMRGTTILSPAELVALAREYQLSLDNLVFGGKEKVYFNYSSFSQPIHNMGDYLEGVKNNLDQVRQLPDIRLLYVSYEIPIFYYCFFPELIAFKLYIWGRTVWEFDYLTNQPFHFEVIAHPEVELTKDILHKFIAFDSTELWSVNIVDNTLSQIEYFSNTGNFKNPDNALVLLDRLTELVAHWDSMATAGFKFAPDAGPDFPKGAFQLFQHEMLVTGNTILACSSKGNLLFNIFNNPNYLSTSDPRMCAYQEEWFRKAISKSIPISKNNERSRALFFNILNKKISATRRRIEAMMG